MSKTTKIIIGVIIAVIVIGGIWYETTRKPAEKNTIKIGVLAVLSGDGAAWGENAKKGIDLALEEVSSSLGKKIEIIYEDTGGEAKRAVSAYQKFINIDKVDAIIGPLLQTEVSAIAPLVDKDKIPVIAPANAPISNRPNPRNPLMVWMNPTVEAERMAEYVYNQGLRKIGIIGTLDSWENEVSSAFASKFISLGGEVLDKEIVQPDTGDIRLTVAKVLNKKPEAIFLGTYYQFVQAIRPIKELGFKGKLYSIEVDSYLANETKQFSDNLEFISPQSYAEDFINKFENKYGEKPGIPAGQAYDAANVLFSFLEKYSAKAEILKAMENFKEYDGVSGKITITSDNKTLFPTAVFKLRNGEAMKINW